MLLFVAFFAHTIFLSSPHLTMSIKTGPHYCLGTKLPYVETDGEKTPPPFNPTWIEEEIKEYLAYLAHQLQSTTKGVESDSEEDDGINVVFPESIKVDKEDKITKYIYLFQVDFLKESAKSSIHLTLTIKLDKSDPSFRDLSFVQA